MDRYNQGAQVGSDVNLGRCRESLKPLTAPFYALRLVPLLYNTQGGPRRDSCAWVLDVDGQPVPGLYALESSVPSGFPVSDLIAEALAMAGLPAISPPTGSLLVPMSGRINRRTKKAVLP
jgi:hypothetical protein